MSGGLIADYLERAVATIAGVVAEPLEAAWVVGSLATDDFSAPRSDIDLIVVTRAAPSRETKTDLARTLDHRVLACPADGLDLVVYRKGAIAKIVRHPEYEFSISTGREWDTEASYGGPYPGGLIDLAASLQVGRSLHGPPPREVVGPVPDRWVAEELLASLEWHVEHVHHPFHDPSGSNAVLNACRALHYFVTGTFVSKRTGAEWLLRTRSVPVVVEALEYRRRRSTARLDRTEVVAFLREAIAARGAGRD
ncbi:MAG: DUF4111 domain-containing protein [Longimicrobiales bacterium]